MIFISGDLPGKQTYPISWRTGAQTGDYFGGGFDAALQLFKDQAKVFSKCRLSTDLKQSCPSWPQLFECCTYRTTVAVYQHILNVPLAELEFKV